MSESFAKNTIKKGFTAPVLKDNTTTHGLSEENKGGHDKPKKLKQKDNSTKHGLSEENKGGHGKPKKLKEKDNSATHGLSEENKVGHDKSKKLKQKPVSSLSDSQYEDIFSAVLSVQKNNTNSQHVSTEEMVNSCERQKENTPSNEIQESSEKQQNRPMSEETIPPATPGKQQRLETKTPPSSRKALSELSPWGSHFSKQPSQGSSILKEMQESQNSHQLSMMSSDSSSSSEEREDSREEEDDEEPSQKGSCGQLSQVTGFGSQGCKLGTDQRKRLEDLQRHRNVGVWVYCCRQSCQKQRYLANITDPQDVPDIWYCHMNPDPKYNDCQYAEQKLSAEEEDDMIFNQFTAGSLVWAHVDGYPWWPAMVDDDPDLEQYYWLADDFMTVTYYHVVFFDEASVTRAWVNLKNIAPYTNNRGSKYKQRMARGIDYSRRIMVAKEQADDAVGLSTTQRLKIYSFIARYKGHITTSASQAKKTITKYKLKVVKKDTLKKSKTQVNSQKERRENNVVLKRKKKQEKDIKARVKDLNETVLSNKSSGNAKYEEMNLTGKRKRNKYEEKNNNKSKKSKTVFEKKADAIRNKKPNEQMSTKDVVKPNDSYLKSTTSNKSITEKSVKQKKKQQNSSTDPNGTKERLLVQSDVVSLSSVNNKLTEGMKNASIKRDNKQTKEIEKVIEETVVLDKEKDEEDFIEPSVISVLQTHNESGQDPLLVEKDVTNVEENKLIHEEQPESETPSGLEFNLNLSQKSSDRRNLHEPCVQNTDDVDYSLIQPTQESKLSQSTVADFFAVESEDAVVPEADILSQLSSQPFEE